LPGRWRGPVFSTARRTIALAHKLALVLCEHPIHLGRLLRDCQPLESVLTIHRILPRVCFALLA
jgi:hypothetical protein